MNFWVELLGIVSSVIILLSTLCKTNTYKSALTLRILNLIGSLLFTIYGILKPSLSIIMLDGLAIFINGYHIYRLKKDYNK